MWKAYRFLSGIQGKLCKLFQKKENGTKLKIDWKLFKILNGEFKNLKNYLIFAKLNTSRPTKIKITKDNLKFKNFNFKNKKFA